MPRTTAYRRLNDSSGPANVVQLQRSDATPELGFLGGLNRTAYLRSAPATMRLSVDIEAADNLIADLRKALES
jgi:hypothetical protein